jgi:hypothetical protein
MNHGLQAQVLLDLLGLTASVCEHTHSRQSTFPTRTLASRFQSKRSQEQVVAEMGAQRQKDEVPLASQIQGWCRCHLVARGRGSAEGANWLSKGGNKGMLKKNVPGASFTRQAFDGKVRERSG